MAVESRPGRPCVSCGLMYCQVAVFSLQDYVLGQQGGYPEWHQESGIGNVAASPFPCLKLKMEMNMHHFKMII